MVIFYKTWKKCHDIQLTKNKLDLNKLKQKNIKAWLELEPNFPGVATPQSSELIIYIISYAYNPLSMSCPYHYTLSGRTGSALVWQVAGSRLTQRSKSCDLQPALQCAIRGAQGVLPCVGWGGRPVNWIYRL